MEGTSTAPPGDAPLAEKAGTQKGNVRNPGEGRGHQKSYRNDWTNLSLGGILRSHAEKGRKGGDTFMVDLKESEKGEGRRR